MAQYDYKAIVCVRCSVVSNRPDRMECWNCTATR